MKTGEAIVSLLSRYGVTDVFGIPGTHSLELYRGLARSGVRHVLAHHEQGAGFMADGYARTTGRPGVCFVITGAGVTNIATPLGEAYADSVPMLVISPVNEPDGSGRSRGRLHEITDQAAVTAPLTAFSATAQSIDEIPVLLARAFAVFSAERPRPVHISIPLPFLRGEVDGPWVPVKPPAMPRAADEGIDQAGKMIDAAGRPVIIVGGGARFGSEAVVALADTVGCPVIATVAGRGVVPASHPLCVPAQLRAGPVQALLGESDLAIVLGTDLAEPDHWNDALPLPTAQVRVNIDGDALLTGGEVIALKGDVLDAAVRLRHALTAANGAARAVESRRRCERVGADLVPSMTAKERDHWRVLEVLRSALPDNVRVFSDMTQIAYTAIDFMPLERANSWHHPTGYGTLGYALPAAIGGTLADPSGPSAVIVGDAGLQYTLQEMPLAAELGLDLKVLMWNNDGLEQIRDDMVAAGIEPFAVGQRNPDFKALCRACGWRYGRAGEISNLAAEVSELFVHPGPALLQIDQREIGGG